MIFNASGGGGAALNFRVVGGTIAPTNPAENCIWVNTSNTITSWIFSATEPSPAEAGMVWISTGTSSSIELNVLKKNAIQVYPISAKQYVGNAWVDVTAMSYQGGKWVEWIHYLYTDGVFRNELIGGFKAYLAGTEFEITDGIFSIYKVSSYPGGIVSEDQIDTTGSKNIVLKGRTTLQSSAPQNYTAALSTTQDAGGIVASVIIPYSAAAVTVELPIPVDGGKFYLIFTCGAVSSKDQCIAITEMILE